MGQEVVVEDLVEVVALGLGGQGVDDGQVPPQAQGGRHLAELQVEVDQDDRLAHPEGQELGGVGGQERLAAPARGRRDHHDPAPGRTARPVGRQADAAPGDAGRPGQHPGEFAVVGVEGDEVTGPDLDDIGQVGPGSLVEGQHHRHPGVPGVEAGQVAGPGPVHERRPGHDDVPRSGGQPGLGPADVGTGLHQRPGGAGVAADTAGQLAGAVDDEDPGGWAALGPHGQLTSRRALQSIEKLVMSPPPRLRPRAASTGSSSPLSMADRIGLTRARTELSTPPRPSPRPRTWSVRSSGWLSMRLPSPREEEPTVWVLSQSKGPWKVRSLDEPARLMSARAVTLATPRTLRIVASESVGLAALMSLSVPTRARAAWASVWTLTVELLTGVAQVIWRT